MSSDAPIHPVPDPATAPTNPEYNAFVQTIALLRAPGGCPWDAKQTHASIAKNMLEEAYEAVSAIEEGDPDHLREELGDVLLEVVLQAQIASDAGEFDIEDVAHDVHTKIVRRHPHVFGAQASCAAAGLDPDEAERALEDMRRDADPSAQDVLELWDVIKAHERHQNDLRRAEALRAQGIDPDEVPPAGVLDGVPTAQPALMLAQEVSRKTVACGFEWDTIDDVWAKVDEEIAEFKAAADGSPEAELEFGDVLFALVNIARKSGIDAETALRRSCAKFTTRWQAMERAAHTAGRAIDSYPTDELEALWQSAKHSVG